MRSRHENRPIIHLVINIGLVHDKFCLVFMIGKAHGWGTFPKGGAGLGYRLILGTLF